MAKVRFDVQTPLGFTVLTTDEYWERIVSEKHRNMRGHENEVKKTLEDPDLVNKVSLIPMCCYFTDHGKKIGPSQLSDVPTERVF